MRRTSIEAYSRIKENGMLGDLQFLVYDLLYQSGPMTQGEAAHRLKMDRNVASPRFAELERLGVIDSNFKRPCEITGQTCMVWDVTDRLPEQPEKKKTKDQIIQEQAERIRELESENAKLHRMLAGELF